MAQSSITLANVRELAANLHKNTQAGTIEEIEYSVLAWLRVNPPTPLVVGLTTNQVRILTANLVYEKPCIDSPTEVHTVITKALSTLIFEQPTHINSEYVPSWDNAPNWANWLAQDDTGEWCWYEYQPEMKISGGIWDVVGKNQIISYVKNWQQTLQERPVHLLEVGQTWSTDSSDGGINKVKLIGVNSNDVAFQYECDNEIQLFDIFDFRAKFKRVLD